MQNHCVREKKLNSPEAPIETGHPTTAISISRDISPSERFVSIEDEIPMPVLTPANTETDAETCSAAATAVVDNFVAAVTAHSTTAVAASPTGQRSAQLVQEVIDVSEKILKSPNRDQREISNENQRTRNHHSESAFKRPGSPKTTESKRPSRSKNRH